MEINTVNELHPVAIRRQKAGAGSLADNAIFDQRVRRGSGYHNMALIINVASRAGQHLDRVINSNRQNCVIRESVTLRPPPGPGTSYLQTVIPPYCLAVGKRQPIKCHKLRHGKVGARTAICGVIAQRRTSELTEIISGPHTPCSNDLSPAKYRPKPTEPLGRCTLELMKDMCPDDRLIVWARGGMPDSFHRRFLYTAARLWPVRPAEPVCSCRAGATLSNTDQLTGQDGFLPAIRFCTNSILYKTIKRRINRKSSFPLNFLGFFQSNSAFCTLVLLLLLEWLFEGGNTRTGHLGTKGCRFRRDATHSSLEPLENNIRRSRGHKLFLRVLLDCKNPNGNKPSNKKREKGWNRSLTWSSINGNVSQSNEARMSFCDQRSSDTLYT
ncbi:hypothetical protein J6590_034670 [Homalodisca vitripennis]|nr:hypothetical protein J6590_034670 [Homalodisca vitripennis]